MSTYTIGIDLGTTNCTLAYCALDQKNADIHLFDIPQVTAASSCADKPLLPSFVYFPLPEELQAKVAGVDWDPSRNHCIGTFAKERGGELPGRVIASAKSWLCYSGINRREKILPVGTEDEIPKMSPLEAIAELLRHLREAWDHKMGKTPFVDQQVLITVPASFDPSARQLVQEAAQLAGYPEVVLLEEPQAAFYAWLKTHEDNWREKLTVGDCVLVVDIGGGTTDFSLINVVADGGNLTLNRMAVGDHLLLGGDNIDLSLAYLAKNKLEEQGQTIDEWQFRSLVHLCRQAKEKLMATESPERVDITLMGRGSRLIGGTLKTTISRDEAQKLIVDGFFPLIDFQEQAQPERRHGIQQIGLPYAQDPRISSQLAKFLSMDNAFVMPTALLFNGGSLKGEALQKRLEELLNHWAKQLNKEPIKLLPGPDLDFAVSRGAVYYGLARQGKAMRIKSGASRSYFIGVEDAMPAVPGIAPPLKAICVVPFGMEEGTEKELDHQEFTLLLGQNATFRFFSGSSEIPMGTVIKNWKQELVELHPIETHLERTSLDAKTVHVKLKSKITELGVLELWCVAPDERKWKLEFDTRL